MEPPFINKEKIASLLPMEECISVMETMFRSLAKGECVQPLRSLMWLPDKSGLLGMMPGYAGAAGIMGIKIISVFHGNTKAGFPSHQGLVLLFDAKYGQPLMIFDAEEITAQRTAAASAVATRLLARADAERLAILGTGEQAIRHMEAILLVRNIAHIRIWGRNQEQAEKIAADFSFKKKIAVTVSQHPQEAIATSDIVCTVTASEKPVLKGEWLRPGTHINAVGACTPTVRELDSEAVLNAKLFTDNYESIFKEAGDFLIPKKEGLMNESHVKGEIGELLIGVKKGREHNQEITLFKSLGISAEDLFAAWHIYQKLKGKKEGSL